MTALLALAACGSSGGTVAAPSPSPTRASPTPSTASFSDIYTRVSSGVVRIQATTCDGSGVGTGFLLAPDVVATVDHVVAGSVAISLQVPGRTVSGTVIGHDAERDLALVRASAPLTGHTFTFAADAPGVGDRVAALGFPLGEDLTLTQGSISGENRSEDIEGVRRTGLIQTDTAINPGNSGGPLLGTDGTVVGLVDAKNTEAEGIGYAVSSGTAAPLLKAWQASPQTVAAGSCDTPLGPPQQADPGLTPPSGGSADDAAVVTSLDTYFQSINKGDYSTAYYRFTRAQQQRVPFSALTEGAATSFDFDIVVDSIAYDASGATAAVRFTSIQGADNGPDGDTCDHWSLDYRMVKLSGEWFIDSTTAHGGGSGHTTC